VVDRKAINLNALSEIEIETAVYNLLYKEIGIQPSKLLAKQPFVDGLGLDSMDVVSLLIAIEDTFKIEISDQDAESLKTIADVISYLLSRSQNHTGTESHDTQ
jgi:acyl carrier protein